MFKFRVLLITFYGKFSMIGIKIFPHRALFILLLDIPVDI